MFYSSYYKIEDPGFLLGIDARDLQMLQELLHQRTLRMPANREAKAMHYPPLVGFGHWYCSSAKHLLILIH
jgi:hypothetical protein